MSSATLKYVKESPYIHVQEIADLVADMEAILGAMTNQWFDKRWSWWCPNKAAGPMREDREQAKQDFVDWCRAYKRPTIKLHVTDA